MPKNPLTKPRADKGTRRNDKEKDRFYTFRLSPDNEKESRIIQAIDDYLDEHKSESVRHIIVECLGARLPGHLTKEQELAETLEEQIDRLASSIDKLLTMDLQRGNGQSVKQEESSGVNMDYIKRIQATLRGGKK